VAVTQAPEPAPLSAPAPPPESAPLSAGGHRHPTAGQPLSDAHVEVAVSTLTMLAEPTRLRLLWALREGELGVTALAQAAGCTPTTASQHLSKLRLSGLVDQRADGRARLYRLRGAHLRRLLDEVVSHAEHALDGIPHHG
jgi:DNA-binding transcriptional ArsR family regulator